MFIFLQLISLMVLSPNLHISNNTFDRFYLELYAHDDGVPQYKVFVHNSPNNIKQYITVDNSFITDGFVPHYLLMII